MYDFFNKTVFRGTRLARGIAQFRIPRTDCTDAPPRVVINSRACRSRDKGLVLGVFCGEEGARLTATAERYDRGVDGKLSELLRLSPVPALGECRVFFDVDDDFGYVALAGLGAECLARDSGEQLDETREAARAAAAVGALALLPLRPTALHVEALGNAEAAAEGATLGTWTFCEYRRNPKPMPALHLHDDCDETGWRLGELQAEAQNLARYLQEMPANLLDPTSFAKIAVELLCELDINVEVMTRGWAADHDMCGFAASGERTVRPPLYVEASYYGAGRAPPVVLVGKGVTFDCGARPPEELRHMRGDMAGAAVALATLRAAARLRLPVNLRALLPLCEPTDPREPWGCLLLADSLARARLRKPRAVVSVGTMSRSLCAFLGGAACALYTNDERLARHAAAASASSGDRVWRMPLWECYSSGAARSEDPRAESPCCAAYLRGYVGECAWLHLDTYNVAYSKGRDFPYLTRGMTGRPTRTLLQLLSRVIRDDSL